MTPENEIAYKILDIHYLNAEVYRVQKGINDFLVAKKLEVKYELLEKPNFEYLDIGYLTRLFEEYQRRLYELKVELESMAKI